MKVKVKTIWVRRRAPPDGGFGKGRVLRAVAKSSKLAALEASRSNGYVLVASPTVGLFRRGRTIKGKKQPPIFNEGDLIKEGQVIGYVDQFGTKLPVKTDVGGEVLKLLFNDGDVVGYGDTLIASMWTNTKRRRNWSTDWAPTDTVGYADTVSERRRCCLLGDGDTMASAQKDLHVGNATDAMTIMTTATPIRHRMNTEAEFAYGTGFN